MSTSTIRFDGVLPEMAELTLTLLGVDVLNSSLFLRDAAGRMTLVLRQPIDSEARASFDKTAASRLGAYVAGPTATPDELFEDDLAEEEIGLFEPVEIHEKQYFVRLLDRRIVGQDWNTPDFDFSVATPVFVFFSCKGGVGRSTALAVTAAALSDEGRNVLIVDLDLEAPGIGTILLEEDNLPNFGVLDYLIEKDANLTDAVFLEDCISPSPLTAGKGLVEVMPAVGRTSAREPQNVLPKLGRAFIERLSSDGLPLSFMAQVQRLLQDVSSRGKSDVILVDARAGLSESSASTLLALGGTILMFGVDTPQTFECYRYLFAQMNRFALNNLSENVWRHRIQMIHAKASRGAAAHKRFSDKCQVLFSEFLYDEAEANDFDAFNFDLDDELAPHFAWPIPNDIEFAEFDPKSRQDQLSREFFDRSFGPFVRKISEIVSVIEDLEMQDVEPNDE